MNKKEIKVVKHTNNILSIFFVDKFSKIISSGSGAGDTSINSSISLVFNISRLLVIKHSQKIYLKFLNKNIIFENKFYLYITKNVSCSLIVEKDTKTTLAKFDFLIT